MNSSGQQNLGLPVFANKRAQKFVNLEGWKHPLQLSVDLLFLTLLNIKDYGFKYKITRIWLSVPRNTAEGWEDDSLKESLQFLCHTKIPKGEL